MANSIDKLAWIHIVDRKILVTRSQGKDLFYLPGGKREEGETDQQALLREIQEELSVELQPETISYLGTFEAQAHGKPEGIMVKTTCYQASYTGHIQAANEIAETAFLSYQERSRCSLVLQIILDTLKDQGIID
ncbi:NUDIX hydrolase [Dictyobacter kobayashii]|uniref:DNA mismatch repair protein MutT n=1 Tax=Dictyobacter kobayashii TaxID=2014872 RepID=A0A402AUC8_9CHLR|nr:NUDIX domain-containing protein [Dictyobacter kobayashii]GCE22722.1 DNA mismatch repair protein MutT [Dictyobacter kobayashii]